MIVKYKSMIVKYKSMIVKYKRNVNMSSLYTNFAE